MTTTKGTAEDMVAIATMAGETMVEWLRDIEGFQGLLMLTNNETGMTHVISFWESKEIAERSRVARLKLRDRITTSPHFGTPRGRTEERRRLFAERRPRRSVGSGGWRSASSASARAQSS